MESLIEALFSDTALVGGGGFTSFAILFYIFKAYKKSSDDAHHKTHKTLEDLTGAISTISTTCALMEQDLKHGKGEFKEVKARQNRHSEKLDVQAGKIAVLEGKAT